MMRAVIAALLTVGLVAAAPAAAVEDDTSRQPAITVFQSGGLEPETIATVERVADQVGASVSIIHAGTLRLLRVSRGSEVIQGFDPRYGVPMSVRVIDPVEMAPLVDTGLRSAIEGPDSLVMSERSAALRGAEAGDVVRMEGWNGAEIDLTIAAIFPDAELDWYEIVVSSSTAARLDLERPSRIVLWNVPSGDLVEMLLSGIDSEQSIRVTALGDEIDTTDFTLSTIEQKERFGEFSFRRSDRGDFIVIDPAWVDENIVSVRFPETGPFRCHRAVVPYLRSAMAELRELGLTDLIDFSDFQTSGGCYVPRLMRGGDKGFALSRHAWGTAIDFNPSTNRYGGETTLPVEFGEVFRRWGFAWGAGWTVPDGMHFEWKRIPEDADRHQCAPVRISRTSPGDLRVEFLDAGDDAC